MFAAALRQRRDAAPEDEVVTIYQPAYVDQDGNPVPPPSPSPPPKQKQRDVTTTAGKTKGGIVYSPYNADNSCKSQDQFLNDVSALSSFTFLRLYGTDCSQVTYGILAAKKFGLKLFLGIHNIFNCDSEIANLIKLVNGEWGLVHTVAVGNEVVNSGQMAAGDVAARVNSARSALRGAGYNGPVVTADTFVAIMANPVLCQASDYVAANCHPFFDGKVAAAGAGDFLKIQSQNVKNACGGKDVLITGTYCPPPPSPFTLRLGC
jgi:exo-beta-1,3-glucanase (GH17 family)